MCLNEISYLFKRGIAMKKCLKTILGISFAVSALAFSASVGAASSFGSLKAEMAKADSTYSGSIIIQKNDDDMKWDGSNLVGYFWDGSSHNGWAVAVQNDGKKYQEYSWELSFEPTHIIVARVHSDWTSSDGFADKVYCRSGNVELNMTNVVWMTGSATEGSGWGTYALNAAVKGGASDDWSSPTVDYNLTQVKVSGGGEHIEAYDSVTLPANTYFKVVKEGSEWYGDYSAHSSIAGNLENSVSGNIHNTAAATYDFYFDYDTHAIYITDPDYAAADEWAQYFLNHVGCDPTGVNLPSGWSSCAAKYALLSGDAKDIVYGATADESGNYIEQAVKRYDVAISRHPSLAKFIVDHDDHERASSFVSFVPTIRSRNSTTLIVILTISSVVAISGGLFIFLLKKKKTSK